MNPSSKRCERCGDEFTRKPNRSNAQWEQQIFCSQKCAALERGVCLQGRSPVNFEDLTGRRFGRGVVTRRVEGNIGSGTNAKWVLRCDCGNEYTCLSSNLKSGKQVSCGCYLSDLLAERNRSAEMRALVGDRDWQGGITRTPSGKWGVQFKLNGENIWFGTFPSKDEALQAAKQARDFYRDYTDAPDTTRALMFHRFVKIDSDWPNLQRDRRRGGEFGWRVEVKSGDDYFRRYFDYAQELEAALWAVDKKLELGHGPTQRLIDRRESILEAMVAEQIELEAINA